MQQVKLKSDMSVAAFTSILRTHTHPAGTRTWVTFSRLQTDPLHSKNKSSDTALA